jgi:hypothetical protein
MTDLASELGGIPAFVAKVVVSTIDCSASR